MFRQCATLVGRLPRLLILRTSVLALLMSAAARGDAIVVEGQALNAMGGGVEGAEVSVAPVGEGCKLAEAVATDKTNETGDFRLTLPEGTSGKIVVRVRATDFREFTYTVDLTEDDEPYVVAALQGALDLTGRVTRALTDKPVVGAKVVYRTAARSKKAGTDQQGRYKLTGLQPGPAELVVQADGMAKEIVRLNLTETSTRDVKLKPEVEVTVVVVDDRGRPAAGITVEAISDEPRRSYAAVTDNRGRAKLQGVHPRAQTLRARLLGEQYIIPQSFDHVLPLPEWQEKVTHQIELPRPGKLEGRVVRARDGKPVAHAMVHLGANKARFLTSVNTDSAGRFQVVGVPARQVLVTARHEDFAPAIENAHLRPGSTAKVTLKLPPGAPLAGVVRDGEGMPVVGAGVTVEGWGAYDTLRVHTRTDDEGKFLIEHMPADGVRLAVTARGHTRQLTNTLKPGREIHEIVLGSQSAAATEGKTGRGGLGVLVGGTTLTGRRIAGKDVDGKYVLLHFWTVPCERCKAVVPELLSATKPYKGRNDLVVLGVSLARDDQAAKRAADEQDLPWPQLAGASGRKVARAFHVKTVPTTLLVGPEGKVLVQDMESERVRRELIRYLGGRAPSPRQDVPSVPKF